ncbi:MAG: hypothetical protein RR744_10180 [Cellulosilyticaceae bacterium]
MSRRSVNYIPTPKRIQELLDEGYKYILLVNTYEFDVFTMLKLKHKLDDDCFLVETTNGRCLKLSKWDFAEHVWENNKIGWRSTSFGSIRFIFD